MWIVFLLLAMFFLYLGITIYNIPDNVWDEFQNFEGSGRGLKVKDGELKVVKYKTDADYHRLLNGLGVLK